MKQIKLGVCFFDEKDNIISKKFIDATWSIDLEKDLKEHHDILIKDEISNILTEGFKLALTPEIVKEMLSEITV